MNRTRMGGMRHGRYSSMGRRVWAVTLTAVVCVGCVTAPRPTPPVEVPQTSAPAHQPDSPPPPVSQIIAIAPPSPQAKVDSREHSLRALTQLEQGEETAARRELHEALTLDPGNALAQRLMHQIQVDPVQELGTTHFRYSIQADDSLSKLAQRFLGDKFLFYILSRYNNIAVPSRLHAGQVIKIPGEAPPAPKPKAVEPPKPVMAPKPVEPPKHVTKSQPAPEQQEETHVGSGAERLYQQGLSYRRSGDLTRAHSALNEVLRLVPSHKAAAQASEEVRQELITRAQKDALAAFHRQDLNGSIKGWDEVLRLDPGNETAKLNRARALELKERLERF